MLTKEKLTQYMVLPVTNEQRIIGILWREYKGAAQTEQLLDKCKFVDRWHLLMYVRKSIYMSHTRGVVKLERYGTDPYSGSVYGRLYDNPYEARDTADFVFSLNWQGEQTFLEALPEIQNWQHEHGKRVWSNNRKDYSVYHTTLKGVRKFQAARTA